MPAKWQTWMPFHIDKFRGSPEVIAMHPAARIGYLYLLASSWQTDDCTISADPIDLATESGLGDELWAIYGARILRKFAPVNGRLRNEVVYTEWLEAKRVFESRRASAQRTNTSRSPHAYRTVTDQSPLRSADTRTGTETGTVTETKTGGDERASAHPPEPNASSCDPVTPPAGLTPLVYAKGLLELCHIPVVFATQKAAASAIEAFAKERVIPLHIATATLSTLAQAAIERQERVDRFWFEDSRWKIAINLQPGMRAPSDSAASDIAERLENQFDRGGQLPVDELLRRAISGGFFKGVSTPPDAVKEILQGWRDLRTKMSGKKVAVTH